MYTRLSNTLKNALKKIREDTFTLSKIRKVQFNELVTTPFSQNDNAIARTRIAICISTFNFQTIKHNYKLGPNEKTAYFKPRKRWMSPSFGCTNSCFRSFPSPCQELEKEYKEISRT